MKKMMTVAQANSKLNEDGTFAEEIVMGRHQGNNQEYHHLVDFVDVSPKQVVAVATAYSFLENDDSNRALWVNMQRQAVPLIDPKAPLCWYWYGISKPMIQELQLL